MMNTIQLCQELIRHPSVTPSDGDSPLTYLTSLLSHLGFECHALNYGDTKNVYARKGRSGRNLCFAGHVDVVSPGDVSAWSYPPFSGENDGQFIWGRGAVDMKGAIAAFISAAADNPVNESISLLLTSDEEGPATNGTVKVVEWLSQKNETIDFCIVGEPTSDEAVGDTIKIGRRGSMNATLTVTGQQGHVAYPHLAKNPIPELLNLLTALNNLNLDNGNEHFQPSHLEITSIDIGNSTTNIIPNTAHAKFNVRFNPHHTTESLIQLLNKTLAAALAKTQPIPSPFLQYSLTIQTPSAEPFLTTSDHPGLSLMSQAIQGVCGGRTPILSTDGGTSDARFIHHIAPTIELGLLRGLAHKTDEKVGILELKTLCHIYQRFIQLYFQE